MKGVLTNVLTFSDRCRNPLILLGSVEPYTVQIWSSPRKKP